MRFGLINELSTPRPFTAQTQKAVYENAIEQAVVAEQSGFSSCWCVEHHFLEEYSHSSCPDLFLMAVARATKTLRLGFGIATCVPAIHSPIRWAEKSAFLDVMSGGRVEFGTGRSSTWNELGGFGARIDDTKKSWDEYVRVIPRMWTEERVSFHGSFFSMPERMVLPKPLQKPHPPMWVAVTAPGTELDAAERGMGALIVSITDIERNIPRFKAYRERIKTCEPVGKCINNQIAVVNWLFCHPDAEYARARGEELVRSFSYTAAQTVEISEAYPSSNYSALGLLGSLRADPSAPGAQKELANGACFGNPARLIETIKRWEAAGADQLVFLTQSREIVAQKEILDSIRLFGREVLPHFKDGAGSAAGTM